ncbi:hypothetical protein KUCAC02_003077 [Chaenocephalus aceratus]|uniref:Uncharacterized protein n=1 Tax=Chaenocephalus aceratus TaxID=36190 RepID=A0ACB9WKH1_CHAAC|nr:hypothetical protein KUCAC02_003077 [Chaenocephalus aceratus]
MRVKKGCNSTEVGVPLTIEEDLHGSPVITPEDVLGLQKITETQDNTGGLRRDEERDFAHPVQHNHSLLSRGRAANIFGLSLFLSFFYNL